MTLALQAIVIYIHCVGGVTGCIDYIRSLDTGCTVESATPWPSLAYDQMSRLMVECPNITSVNRLLSFVGKGDLQ